MRILIFIFLFVSFFASGQKVTVADEINIRNHYAYDMLGNVGGNTLLYLDKGMDHSVNIYDENLRYKRNKELRFEKRKVRVHYLVPKDSTFNVVYSYRERDTIFYKLNEYDRNAVLQDSFTFEKEPAKFLPKNYRYHTSEDKSKTVLFAQEKGKLLFIRVIDNMKNQIMWHADLEMKKIDTRDDFRKIYVTNNGIVIYLFQENNSRYSREDHWLTLLGVFEGSIILQTKIDMNDRVACDTEISFNNKTGNVVVAGLSSEKKQRKGNGILLCK